LVDVPDGITCANFGDDQIMGFEVAWGEILTFAIDFDRRPYDTYRVSV